MFVSCVHPVAVLNACCVLHDLQFVNVGRGCRRRPYGGAPNGYSLPLVGVPQLLLFALGHGSSQSRFSSSR